MKLKVLSKGVYEAIGPIAEVTAKDLSLLKKVAASSPRGRSRICLHRSRKDRVQEMVIAVPKGCYIRPHKHPGKSESMHAIEGSADVMIFNDKGKLTERFRISSSGKRDVFFYRIEEPIYHTIIVRSEYFIFHESTAGPFTRSASKGAPWAPEESDKEAGISFLNTAARRAM